MFILSPCSIACEHTDKGDHCPDGMNSHQGKSIKPGLNKMTKRIKRANARCLIIDPQDTFATTLKLPQ